MPSKQCYKCKEIKDLDQFNKDKSAKDKHSSYCRVCSTAAMKVYYKANTEAMNASSREYRQNNVEKMKIQKKIYYEQNSEKIRTYNKTDKKRFYTGKHTAKKRGVYWEITLEQWQDLVIDKKCHYCEGNLPESGCALDRKENKIGYILDNVVACCRECNEIKSDNLTYKEMVEVAKLLKILRNIS